MQIAKVAYGDVKAVGNKIPSRTIVNVSHELARFDDGEKVVIIPFEDYQDLLEASYILYKLRNPQLVMCAECAESPPE